MPAWLLGPGLLMLAFSAVFLTVFERRFGQPPFDLTVYLGGVHEFLSGHPVYDFALQGWPYTYPPVTTALFAPLSALSLSTAHVVLVVTSVVAVGGTAWLTFRTLGYVASAGLLGATLAVTGLSLWLLPILATLEQGQVNILLMWLVVADLAFERHKRWPTGVLIGIATAIKLTPGLFIVYLLLTRRYRAAITAAVTTTVVTGLGFAIAWSDSRRYWFGGTFADSSRVAGPAGVASPSNQSLSGAAARMFGEAGGHIAWYGLAVCIAVVGLGVAVVAHRSGDAVGGYVACAFTGLLISPVSWIEHWVWIVPFVVWLIGLGRRIRQIAPLTAGLLPPLACVPFAYLILPSTTSRTSPLIVGLSGVLDHHFVGRGNHHDVVVVAAASSVYVWFGFAVLVVAAVLLRQPAFTTPADNSPPVDPMSRMVAGVGPGDVVVHQTNMPAPVHESGHSRRDPSQI